MNVAFDPWIPVMTLSGERKPASLVGVLTNGEQYADLAVRPHERVSLMRLFLCIAHAALDGPENHKEWREVPKKLPNAARKYLTKWKDSFELFHRKKPWLQVAELDVLSSRKRSDGEVDEEWSALSKLCFHRASGINTTLFDHESNGGQTTEYNPEEIALNVVTFQNFFVAGGKASSRRWGKIRMKNPENPKGGPCAGKSILFTFIRGSHLQESILLNLSTYHDLRLIYGKGTKWIGQPLWEKPIRSPKDMMAIENATRTHLGRLVPQTRMIRVHQNRKNVLMGPGFVYPKFQDKKNPFNPDQFASVVINKNGESELLSVRQDIAVWRELHALLVRRKDAATSQNRGPLCLRNLRETSDCDISVNAMLTNPKQPAEIVDLIDSVFHVSSRLSSDEGIAVYEREVKAAALVASRLGLAIKECQDQSGDKSSLSSHYALARNQYWTTVEKNLSLLFLHVVASGEAIAVTKGAWRKMLIVAGRESYELACGQETPRQIRAFAKGQQKLVLSEKYLESILDNSKEKSS